MTSRANQDSIYVEGRVVGFQFNKRSLGARWFTRRVDRQPDGTGLVWIGALGRHIRVRPMGDSKHLWEAF